jgi:hypothetical protein
MAQSAGHTVVSVDRAVRAPAASLFAVAGRARRPVSGA